MGSVTVLFTVVALAVLLAALTVRSRSLRRTVMVGDLWECARSKWTGGLYEVVRANDSREAGPDSWVMRRCEDGRTSYMHHSERAKGRWVLVMRDGVPMARGRELLRAGIIGGGP